MAQKEYEPKWSKLDYVISGKTYLPDFVDRTDPTIVYEAKGYFRTFDEAKKYIHIRASHPNINIRFIVGNPNSRAYPQSKQTMGDWLTKQGFEWATEDSIPEDWV